MNKECMAAEECAMERQRRVITDANRSIDFMRHLGGSEMFFNPYRDAILRLEGFVSGNISYENADRERNHQRERKELILKRRAEKEVLVSPKGAEIAELKAKLFIYENKQ